MSIIIDIIIVGILAGSIFLGYQKGLTKCLIKIVSFFIALAVAFILFKPVSNFVIEKTQIDDTIKEAVIHLVGDDVNENGEVKEDTNLPKAMVDYINETVKNTVNDTKNNVVTVAAEGIALTSVNAGVALLLFIVARIALIFVSALSGLITDLPIVKQFDKTGGILYGALKALVIIFVILALISFLSPMIEQTGIIVAINKSFLGSILYDHNILLKMVL